MNAISRRAFCCAALPFVASPALSILTPALAEVSPDHPDAEILFAVSAWLTMDPVVNEMLDRIDDAKDIAFGLLGDCPVSSHEANRAWWDAYNASEAGKLEWAWEDMARIHDGYMTTAVNTPSKTLEGIQAKIRLYKASWHYFDEQDGDPYQIERIQRDIDALGVQ